MRKSLIFLIAVLAITAAAFFLESKREDYSYMTN